MKQVLMKQALMKQIVTMQWVPRLWAFKLWTLSVLAMALVCVGDTVAQPMAAWSVPPRDEAAAARAWIVTGSKARDVTLFELPPRGEVPGAGAVGVEEGTVRPATALQLRPEVIAAIDNRVYMVFDRGVSGFPLEVRSVLSVRSEYFGDRWVTLPAGRFDASAPLPAAGRALSASGVRGRLGVLMLGLPGEDRLSLRVLGDAGWEPFPIPREALDIANRTTRREGSRWESTASWSLSPTPEGCVLFVAAAPSGVDGRAAEDARVVLRAWELKYRTASEDSPRGGIWRELDVSLDPALASALQPGDLRFGVVADQIVMAARDSESVVSTFAASLRSDIVVWRRIAQTSDVSTDWTMAALDNVGRVALFWSVSGEGRGGGGRPERYIAEISLVGERAFHDGPVKVANPLSRSDTRIIVAFLVVLLAVVLVFVIRPDSGDGQIALPANAAVAEPGRRFVASLIDLLLAMTLASQAAGVPVTQMLNPGRWASEDGQLVILIALGILVIGGALMETLLGKTPGKFLLSCEVLQLPRGGDASQLTGPGRPTIWRALVRNAIKWGLPPVTLLALVDPIARHRGDQLARTIVIIRFDVPTGGGDETTPDVPKDR